MVFFQVKNKPHADKFCVFIPGLGVDTNNDPRASLSILIKIHSQVLAEKIALIQHNSHLASRETVSFVLTSVFRWQKVFKVCHCQWWTAISCVVPPEAPPPNS